MDPTGATIADPTGTGTILDDDTGTLSISDDLGYEGDEGSTKMIFPVQLTTSTSTVTVAYATTDRTATAGRLPGHSGDADLPPGTADQLGRGQRLRRHRSRTARSL
ncbi:hypothetical protein BH20ACT5_BH20ACT5_25290 [soil metagenome]